MCGSWVWALRLGRRQLPPLFIGPQRRWGQHQEDRKRDLNMAVANLKVTSKPTHPSRTGAQRHHRGPARIAKDSRLTASMQNYVPPKRMSESSWDPYLPEKRRAGAPEFVQLGLQARACYCWDPPSSTGPSQLWAGDTEVTTATIQVSVRSGSSSIKLIRSHCNFPICKWKKGSNQLFPHWRSQMPPKPAQIWPYQFC